MRVLEYNSKWIWINLGSLWIAHIRKEKNPFKHTQPTSQTEQVHHRSNLVNTITFLQDVSLPLKPDFTFQYNEQFKIMNNMKKELKCGWSTFPVT